MNAGHLLDELRRRFSRDGLPQVELYRKEGRSRRFESSAAGPTLALQSREEGWAVRAGAAGRSLFATGTGEIDPEGPWPEADGQGLRLPTAGTVAPWTRPAELDAPLLSEGEATGLLARIGSRLAQELPGARLERAQLEEGASTARLASTGGMAVEFEHRSAALLIEASWPGEGPIADAGGVRVTWYLAGRAARAFSPSALGRRLADLLLVRGRGGTVERDRGEILLAAPAAADLIECLLPLFVGPEAGRLSRPFRDRSNRMGGSALTLIDDGRHPGGIFEAPVDGEGVETRRLALVEEGIYRQPLLDWRGAAAGEKWTGCNLRAGWRDRPAAGPTHLYLRPDPSVGAAALLGSVARGFYLLEVLGPGRFDFAADRFELPVCGFALRRGSAAGSFAHATLRGSIAALLRGVQATARDLTFQAGSGRIGAPSILVIGLELVGS
jgi:predicted Zn-dependent protease